MIIQCCLKRHGSCLSHLVAGQDVGAWGEGVAVYGAARGFRCQNTMPMLMASMFGFSCEEEMAEAKQYLLNHGGYQLEQVSEPNLRPVLRHE